MKGSLEAKVKSLERNVTQLNILIKQQQVLLATLSSERPVNHVSSVDNSNRHLHRQHNSIYRTCHEARVANSTLTSGVYWIDPDGQGIGDAPILVDCDMEKGIKLAKRFSVKKKACM